MENLVTNIETFFETYDFFKEVLLVVFGAVLGAIFTAIINYTAIRKQSKFNLQYKILSDEAENIANTHKIISTIEIEISFGTGETELLKGKIDEVNHILLSMSGRLESKRKIVRKYMSAESIEEAAQYASDFAKIFYLQGDNGFYDRQIKTKVDFEEIALLRKFVEDFGTFSDEFTENIECLISPSIFSKLKRKIRKPFMLLEKFNAMRKIEKKMRKK